MADFAYRGVWPIVPTALTADEQVDEAGMRRILEYVIGGGVDGLFMLGTRGEGPNLAPEVHRRVIEITREVSDGRVPFVTGCGDVSTRATIENIDRAADAGADGVHITEPYYYKMKDAELVAHYETVVEASKLPVVIYFHDAKYPNVKAGVVPEVIRRLATHPKVRGIKASTMDLRVAQSMIWSAEEQGADFDVLLAEGKMFAASYQVGAAGSCSPESAFMPRLFADMYGALQAGDLETALELQKAVIPIAIAIDGYGAPSGKVVMAALGLCEEHVSMPLLRMPEPHRQHLIDLVNAIPAKYTGAREPVTA